jgi:hypothetical protein
MRKLINGTVAQFLVLTLLLCALPGKAMAAMDVLGEYSYLHVSFSSIWHIFLFILVLVMMPFFLMIFVAWRRGNSTEDVIDSVSFPDEKKDKHEAKERE